MAVARTTESVVARAIRAAADVIEVDSDDDGFLASVYLVPGQVAVARLAHSLNGHPDEGRILREVMLTTTGLRKPGLHLWIDELSPSPESVQPVLS